MSSRTTVIAALVTVLGCGSDDPQGADPEAVRAGLLELVAADPRLATQTPLAPDDYATLAERVAALPGVAGAEYAGDTLGTIDVRVEGAGVISWRHIRDGWKELATLPAEADFKAQLHPRYNAGWSATPVDWPTKPAVGANTFFTHFPVANLDPDPEWSADESLACPVEGKIAIVDFQYSEMGPNEREAMTSDGVMLYDRVRAMAEAAGYRFDLFKDAEINSTNFDKLEQYDIVIVIAHGSFPNPDTAKRVGMAMPTIMTPERYDAGKVIVGGKTQYQAWKEGMLLRDEDEGVTRVKWTPRLFANLYHPAVPQLFMINTCWGLLTKDDQGFGRVGKVWSWGRNGTTTLYNLGDGLMDAGVKVVFGYVTPASPAAILENTMTFFRRMFGGYYSGDRPPSRFPQRFWPTCMGAQTYFRRPETPDQALYANKVRGDKTIYTMYAVAENQYFREVCAYGNQHAMLQDFTFTTGSEAGGFLDCWDKWWSQGKDPTSVQDVFCAKGEPATTQEKTRLAACAVKIARKVTNAMLQ